MKLVLAVSILFCPVLTAAQWSVPARVVVTSDDVSLADLVGGAPTAWARVSLGKAPRPGGQRTLNRQWVLQKARDVGAEGSLDLPEAVVLTRTGRAVDREEVAQAVESALKGSLGPGESLRVVSVGLPGPLPEGELDLNVSAPQGELSAPTTVWVDVLSGGRKAGRAWARVEVSRSGPVVVLSRRAQKGEVLRPEDLDVRTVKGSPSARPPLADPAAAVGKRLLRSVSAGSPVCASDLEIPPLVDKGDLVQVVVKVGAVTASAMGKALERGRPGEELRVENLGSGRVVQGVLQESGTVVVRSDLEMRR